MITRRPEDPVRELKALEEELSRRRAAASAPKGAEQQDAGMALRLGVEFVSGVLVGAFLGYWADHFFGTWPWLFILCFLLGLGAGVLTMYRTLKASSYEASVDTRAAPSGAPAGPDEDEED